MHEISNTLDAIDRGEPLAASQLLPLVYDELRRVAAQSSPRRSRAKHLTPPYLSTRHTCGSWRREVRRPAAPAILAGPIADIFRRRRRGDAPYPGRKRPPQGA